MIKIFSGFATENYQARVNSLALGLDGWIYGANGRSDGTIRRPGDATFPTVSLRGRDFRFKPGTGVFETLAGRSQFGLALDEWGNRFLSWNTIPVRHEGGKLLLDVGATTLGEWGVLLEIP